ncbi:MAG: SprT family zinc-dependent metalloprotease [Syntrophobacteraceae bacterium]
MIVHPDNRVIVAAPATYSQKNILQFVEKKADWIRKAIQANLQRGRQCHEKTFQTGDKLLYLGREYILRVERGNAPQVILGDEDICVRLRVEGAGPEPSAVKEHLLGWYHARALAKVKEKVTLYAGLIGVNPRFVVLKSLKSRWGSCSIHGRISLAWNIIMAPEAVLDYLIVHELCHMVHHNHSAAYWRLVQSVLPDHRERRLWLRQHGERLTF